MPDNKVSKYDGMLGLLTLLTMPLLVLLSFLALIPITIIGGITTALVYIGIPEHISKVLGVIFGGIIGCSIIWWLYLHLNEIRTGDEGCFGLGGTYSQQEC